MFRRDKFWQRVAIVTIIFGLPIAAYGQAQTDSATDASNSAASAAGATAGASTDQLQEVTVTATRVALNIQKVPMSVAAVTSQQLVQQSVQTVRDTVAAVPDINIGGAAGASYDPIISIRGIPGAGLFIDGIYQFNDTDLADLAGSGVLELNRVEVLRGPQGTLYGHDTTSGVIRIFTQLPAKTFGVRVLTTYGSYNRHDITVNADIPLTDSLFSKLTFSSTSTDGFINSVTVNRAYGGLASQHLRADFLWQPTDGFSARLTGFRTKSSGTEPNYTGLILDSSPPGTPIVPGFGWQVPNHEYYRLVGTPLDCQTSVPGCPGGALKPLQTTADFLGPGILITTNQANLNINWQITQSISLASLGSYSDETSWDYENFSNSDIPYFSQGNYTWQHDWSEELQLTGNEGRYHWLGGAYGWHDSSTTNFMRWAFWNFSQPMNPSAPLNFNTLVADSPECASWDPSSGLTPCVMQPASSNSITGQSDEGWATFAQLSVDLTSSLSATVGARFQNETDATWSEAFCPDTGKQSLTPGELPADPGSLLNTCGTYGKTPFSFTKPSYHWALNNQFTPEVMGYLQYSEGYNAGGDNLVALPEINPATNQPYTYDKKYAPETINNYELGVKSEWFERRLQVNADYFLMYWENIQVQGTVYDPFTGIELPTYLIQNEAKARTNGLELDLQGLVTRHLRFNFDMATLEAKYTQVDPGSEISLDSRFGQAPHLQYTVGAQWTSPTIRNYQLMVSADDTYTSGFDRTYVPGDQETTYTGEWDQPAYAVVKARVTLAPTNDKWELSAFVTNLTNRIYSTGGFFSPLLQVDNETIAPPREYGLSLKLNIQ